MQLKHGIWLFSILACAYAMSACAERPLETVEAFSIEKYLGRWHQIALLPNRFQKECVGETTANYSLLSDGKLRVLNRCRIANGEYIEATGEGRINRRYGDPARLQVRFAPAWLSWLALVWGDYWVMSIDEDYSSVMVGTPSREYLWILAREPALSETRYQQLIERAKLAGFTTDRLQREVSTPD